MSGHDGGAWGFPGAHDGRGGGAGHHGGAGSGPGAGAHAGVGADGADMGHWPMTPPHLETTDLPAAWLADYLVAADANGWTRDADRLASAQLVPPASPRRARLVHPSGAATWVEFERAFRERFMGDREIDRVIDLIKHRRQMIVDTPQARGGRGPTRTAPRSRPVWTTWVRSSVTVIVTAPSCGGSAGSSPGTPPPTRCTCS
jgi:hypothetical protein